MRRYLIVANQTLNGPTLQAKVRELASGGECSFYLVVPATAPQDHITWTEGEARALAARQLDEALTRFRDMGADADGEVGDANPLYAIGDVLRTREADEIILSTLPSGMSRWLKLDLPHRVERSFDVPVVHLEASKDDG